MELDGEEEVLDGVLEDGEVHGEEEVLDGVLEDGEDMEDIIALTGDPNF